jgi:outer membrane receptor protein involved in Fe transport
MRVQSTVPWLVIVGTLTSLSSQAVVGQELTLAPRTPRFFYASSTATRPVEINLSHNAVLSRVVSLQVTHATIGALLAEIQRQTGLTFAYDPHFPATRAVTLEAESITVAAALGAILVGTGVDVVLTRTGHVWLTETKQPAPRAQEGTIVGTVTDKQTSEPIIGATVTLDPSRETATTGTDGRFRFLRLVPGTYKVRARYIGYTSLVASVEVSQDQQTTLALPLEKSAQQLDDVVTTGTVVPTEVKALPTPVSVISESDIVRQRPHNLQALIRHAVPGAVSWDQPSGPYNTPFSVRGASTLTGLAVGQMKVFVDGIETASASLAAVDPNSIARVEVIRGPQAAAIYGSAAIGGVIQVFTKRGDPKLARPQVDAEGAFGVVQTPYSGFNGVVRQAYTASVRGGSSDVSYHIGGGYSHTADYLPNGEQSAQSSPSVYGGMRFARGIMTVDLSGRYYAQDVPSVFNPDLAQTGFPDWMKPNYSPARYRNQTVGARVGIASTRWWQHTVTVGLDHFDQDLAGSRPRLTSPADTLMFVRSSSQTKASIGYNTAVEGRLGSDMSGSLMVGFDHYSLPVEEFSTFGALSTTGTIRTAPGSAISASRTITKNTGYFGQVQVGFRERLFLTGGLRAEQNTNFGDSLGTPISPRVGLSYVQPVGQTTLKLRGSWGRAIRAPSPGQKLAAPGVTAVTLPNPELGPERQQGWDAGVDAAFGPRGSLSVTYYDQIARDLIQFVRLQAASVLTSQFQNVGRVKNTGVEVEGSLFIGPLLLKGQYGYARARIEDLAPNYTGDLRVGDQALLAPKHTAGVSLSVAPFARTSISAGVTYVGSWNNYDYMAEFSCFGGSGPCKPTFRDYIVAYPGFVKLNARVSQQIRSFISGFIAVDNLTNNQAFEVDNLAPVVGRIATIGFQFQY